MLDEGIRVLKELWRDEQSNRFNGKYVNYSDMSFFPKPVQKGGPKVLVGGMTDPSLRRAALLGDGWIPWAVSPQELKDGAARIRAYAGDREPEMVCMMPVDVNPGAMRRYTGVFGEDHRLLSGSVADLTRMVAEFQDAGLRHLVCSFRDVRLFRDETAELMHAQMRTFAHEVMPRFLG
jgi:alkanesulfonate monooxygenase SsuD/methylene tetrahydromethanopterin reductase-like flavin-dependent oxidoreductase (luciferase family)